MLQQGSASRGTGWERKGRVGSRESLPNKVMPEVNFEELIGVKVGKGCPDRRYSHEQRHGDTFRTGKSFE